MNGIPLPISSQASTSRFGNVIARAIYRAFDQSQLQFREITGRAAARFAARDWRGMQDDSSARLDVYETAVDQIVVRVHELPRDVEVLRVGHTQKDDRQVP